MNAPLLRTAGTTLSSSFTSSALRRACILHRSARLKACSASSTGSSARKSSRRQYATSASHGTRTKGHSTNAEPRPPIYSQDLPVVNPAVRDHEPIPQLDPYLPLELRSKTWAENLATFEGVRDPSTLPAVLLEIDSLYQGNSLGTSQLGTGVLAHIALQQHRWPAYMYLAEALIKYKSRRPELANYLQTSPWADVDTTFPSLDVIDGHIVFDRDQFAEAGPGDSGGKVPSMDNLIDGQDSATAHEHAMGLLWQSLASIVLASTGQSAELAARMMSHVHCVLAMMHREDRMHPAIYDFDPETGFDVARKHGFLHIMSSRYMGVISDAMWRIEARKIISFYDMMVATDKNSTGPRLLDADPPVPPIEAEAWLELILWSCVQGNHADAACRILEELTMDETGEKAWSTISWPSLFETAFEGRKRTTPEVRRVQKRFNRVAGDSSSVEPPMVVLPHRTLSREVVAAALQLSVSSPVTVTPHGLADFMPKLLEGLLPPTRDFAMEQFWVSVVDQLLNLADFVPERYPIFIDQVGKLIKAVNNVASSQDLGSTGEDAGPQIDSGVPVRSIHHRAMSAFLALGDLDGALHAYIRLQKWLTRQKVALERSWQELEKAEAAKTSIRRSKNRMLLPPDTEALRQAREAKSQQDREVLGMALPDGILASFLELSIKRQRPELADKLLTPADADSTIADHYYRSLILQPALIRHGVASKNYHSLREIAQRVNLGDIANRPALFHALLFAQISFLEFAQARNILQTMGELEIEISSEAVMVLARTIFELEYATPGAHTQQNLDEACVLLREILTRRYVVSRPFTEPKHDGFRRLNQLCRVLASTSGYLYDASVSGIVTDGKSSGKVEIAADDFNILLRAVVQFQGPAMGKALYDRWCHASHAQILVHSVQSGNPSQLVEATPDRWLPIQEKGGVDSDESCVPAAVINVQAIIEPIIAKFQEPAIELEQQADGTNAESMDSKVFGLDTLEPIRPDSAAIRSEDDDGAVKNTAQHYEIMHMPGLRRPFGLAIRRNLPLRPLDYALLDWAKDTLLKMGWKEEDVVHEYPQVYDIRSRDDSDAQDRQLDNEISGIFGSRAQSKPA